MITFLLGVIIGAIGFYLVLKNNPSLSKKIGFIVDKVKKEIKK